MTPKSYIPDFTLCQGPILTDGPRIGSTEMQSFDLDALRQQAFDDYVDEIGGDRERELADDAPLSALLEAQCKDIWMRINQAVQRRTYRPMREWL